MELHQHEKQNKGAAACQLSQTRDTENVVPFSTQSYHKRDVSEPKPDGSSKHQQAYTGPPRSSSKMGDVKNESIKASKNNKDQQQQLDQLNSQMMKALKLFAKNHHELEKVSDPDKGNNRRVLSYDGRRQSKSTINTPASTFEKCGGTVPAGPKFINELVEKELSNYKVEVEQKFKASKMNSTYVFPMKQPKQQQPPIAPPSAQQIGVGVTSFTKTPNQQHQGKNGGVAGINSINNQHLQLQSIKKDTSASPQSHLIVLKPNGGKQNSSMVVNKADVQQQSNSQAVLFTKKNNQQDIQSRKSDLYQNQINHAHHYHPQQQQQQKHISLRCESIPSNNEQSTELLLDEDDKMHLQVKTVQAARNQHGVTTLQQQKRNNYEETILKSIEAPSSHNNNKIPLPPKTQVHSPVNSSKYNHVISNANHVVITNDKHHQTVKPVKKESSKKQTESHDARVPQKNDNNNSSFFHNMNQAFNKTTHQQPQQQQQQQQQQQVQNQPQTSIVINKPIVIQFQNKKITFKNHHHYHHHHHHHGTGVDVPTESQPPQSQQSTRQKTSKSNPCTKKASPHQLSPRHTHNTTIINNKPSKAGLNSSTIEQDMYLNPTQPLNAQAFLQQQSFNQHVKLTPKQEQIMSKMKRPAQMPQHLVNPPQVIKPSTLQMARKSDIVSTTNGFLQPSTPGGVQQKSKKHQVNQILQQILSFEPNSYTQPPSPKSFEFSTQQVQPKSKQTFDDGSLGSKFVQQTTSTIGGAVSNNSLGRPRQSGNHENPSQLKLNNIAQNFGISKTQDSKKQPTGSQGKSKDGENSSVHHLNQGTINNLMADFNIVDHLKVHSNESVSMLGGRSDQNHTGASIMINNNSFTSNFRTQVPTGTKLIINGGHQHISQVDKITKQKQQNKYQANNISHTGVVSPKINSGLGPSLTMDITNKPNKTTLGVSSRPQISQNQQSRIMASSKQQYSTNISMNQSMIMDSGKPPGTGKPLKKKQVSIGSAHQTLRNSVQGQSQKSNQQMMAGLHVPVNNFQQFENQAAQLAQSSRLVKKNQLQKKLQIHSQDNHISQMKEQIMKAAYSTSFNSPHRLSQHHGPPPIISATHNNNVPFFNSNNQHNTSGTTGGHGGGGGLVNNSVLGYELSMDERRMQQNQKNKLIKGGGISSSTSSKNTLTGGGKAANTHHSLSNSRKMSANNR